MLDSTMIALNATGWLRESERAQRERLTENRRTIVHECINQLRAVAAGRQATVNC
jgi:hypothetical protein